MYILLTAICAAIAIAGFLTEMKEPKPTRHGLAIAAVGALGAATFAILAHVTPVYA